MNLPKSNSLSQAVKVTCVSQPLIRSLLNVKSLVYVEALTVISTKKHELCQSHQRNMKLLSSMFVTVHLT